MSQVVDTEKKDAFADAMLDTWDKVRDAIDSRVPDVTIADLPEKARDQLAANVDTKIIVADMLTAQVAELEAANPTLVNELRIATDDVRMIMTGEVDRRAEWHKERRADTRRQAGIE